MKKFFTILSFGIIFSFQLSAQIQPPEFLCVRGDTLFWNLPVNNCGPFNSYEVWGSQSPDGPFVLLGAVTNQARDFYYHVNPSGEQWFFYLQSNYNCPGQTAIPSDTLDNRPPEVSAIQSVSVNNGDVMVTWKPSPSPEVFAYIIYRETPIGVVPIDTVFSGNTYLDTNAAPDMQQESYFVNALDHCGNTSIFDLKHSTVFLEGTLNPCRQSVSLSWNLYQNWTNGIGEQQIWAGVNGATPMMAGTTGVSATTFEFNNLNDGDTYCLFVQAVEAGTGVVSRSNEICIQADIIQAAKDMFIKNVTVTPGNQVEVTWAWNTNAEINEVQILSSPQNANYQPVLTQTAQLPLPPEVTYVDGSAQPDNNSVFYKIQTRDDCDSLALSTYGATIFLSGEIQSSSVNRLKWNSLDLQGAVVTGYEIFKVIGGGTPASMGTVNGTTTTFDDHFDPTNLAETKACYYVIATANLTTPAGGVITIQSRSNTTCAEKDVLILVPNAFAPEGYNQRFKPLILLADLASYEMRIFDRNGQEVFISRSKDDGWNGRKGGKNLPQGTYVYQIRVIQANGRITEKRGMVLLLR
jgi:gliding motility-associated-like protein